MMLLCTKPTRDCAGTEHLGIGRLAYHGYEIATSHQVLTHNVLNTCTFSTCCFFFLFFFLRSTADRILQFIPWQPQCQLVYSQLQRAGTFNKLRQAKIPCTIHKIVVLSS